MVRGHRPKKMGSAIFRSNLRASFVAITPTIALSDRILIGGLDPVSVEEAMKRAGGASSELAESPTYKGADRLLPAPTNFFAYIDTAQLYSRLDASLRPMLLMAAAFVPAVAGSIDPGKLPAPEVITKHLSPIVSSQRYDGDGYVAESIGPITLDQLGIGVAIFSSFGAAAARQTGFGTPAKVLPWHPPHHRHLRSKVILQSLRWGTPKLGPQPCVLCHSGTPRISLTKAKKTTAISQKSVTV